MCTTWARESKKNSTDGQCGQAVTWSENTMPGGGKLFALPRWTIDESAVGGAPRGCQGGERSLTQTLALGAQSRGIF